MKAPTFLPGRELGAAVSSTRSTVNSLALTLFGLALLAPGAPLLTGLASAQDYPDFKTLSQSLEQLARDSKQSRVVELAETPGGHQLQMLQILPAGASGADGGGSGKRSGDKTGATDQPPPAILVIADPLGITPLATAAALHLASLLTNPTASVPGSEGRAAGFAWYIVPVANPDAAARRVRTPVHADGRNDTAVDDDKDGAFGEDPPDDLNGDGLITTMLVPDPAGSWLLTEDEPPLTKQADAAKGEKGLYLQMAEGKDDDGDGLFNEDGAGGVVIGRNLPHAFEHWTATGGRWAASEPESRAILEFAFAHPEIAMVVVFGATNNLAQVPESDKQVEAGGGKYKLPERFARRMGIDPETEFELDTLVQMARDFTGMTSLTADDVLAFLDLGAAVNPNRNDLSWWNALSERYKEFMKDTGMDGPRVEPPPSTPGSIEEWAYYQYGVPAFALDFWSVPKPADSAAGDGDADGEASTAGAPGGTPDVPTPDEIEAMSRDDFIALGENTIDAMLKANAAPPHINATMVINALQSGMLTTTKIAEMMREQAEQKEAEGVDPDLSALATFSADRLAGQGYLPWDRVTLPDGREALVGGAAPFAMTTPPAAWGDSLVSAQVPFLLEMVTWLPEIGVDSVELDHRGAGVYEVKVHVGNMRRIPYPTGQGARCKRPPPVAVTLEGVEILEGNSRQTINEVPGLGTASTRWLVRGPRDSRLTITVTTPSAGGDTQIVVLDGEGGLR